ncbi:BamA/TamA family outer membrane protein [Flammeovirga sp. EKP202]|uniref:translocation and assembly module lipoprotein TamL n=1 Tax=Flammeovirga sp. EKP202 TaxID=2770592 RepID=UPI00165ECEB2|nr:BamA/TamA family outer membrane protein [Flammeovirga sp. EKP202]MBD0402186.1 BamA/TamA family outer membrane protein [Flammeovirga sp. EKP202]
MMNKLFFNISLILLLALNSCRITKYIEEDKAFYTGATIEYHTDTVGVDGDLKYALLEVAETTAPNSKSGAWYYYRGEKAKHPKGMKKWMAKTFGSKPVYYDENVMQKTADLIQNNLNNNGYFDAKVYHKKKSDKATKSASVKYEVYVKKTPYRLDSISWELESDIPLNQKVLAIKDQSELVGGERYSLDNFREERIRINNALKDSGFYFFSSNYLMFDLDSANGDNTIDVKAYFKEMPQKTKRLYTIDSVLLQPDFDLDGLNASKRKQKIIEIDSGIIYKGDPVNLKPKILEQTLQTRTGDIYSRHKHQASLRQFSGLGVFKYVNMEFTPKPTDDPNYGKLDVNAKMSQVTLHAISTELAMSTWSTGYSGPELDITWKNRNTFGGAERLSITGFTGIQKQFGGKGNGIDAIAWYGIDAKLSIPRVIAPIEVHPGSDFYIPYTNFGVGFKRYHFLPKYTLNYFNTSYGFEWRTNENIKHTLNPVAISFQATGSTDSTTIGQAFPSLEETFRDQFILGSNYTFEYAPTWDKKKSWGSFYYKGDIAISGNLWYAAMQAFGGEKNPTTGQYEIFGSPFSQYVRFTNDFRFFFRTSKKGSLANRLVIGYSKPWGNSTALPFVQQYFVGGPNSIRAFKTRTLGPGSYDPSQNTNPGEDSQDIGFGEQAGDLKLEGSVEYRYDLHQYLKLAAFVDYGNVWLSNKNDDLPGGEFKLENMFNEMAIGAGIGLRVDVQFFVLRFDFAVPVKVPYVPEDGDQWVIKNTKFNDIVFNLAIGYPF